MPITRPAPAPPPMPPELEEARQRIDRALALAAPPWTFEAELAASEELEERARALAIIRDNLDKSLVILLLGGTGVGKSSMLNALAGKPIARVSSARPCTTATTFYASRSRDIDDLKEMVESNDFRVEGAGEELSGKVVVDPPDFDSTNPENRAKLLRMLDVADLAVVVANRVKYRQAELFDLLRRFKKAKTFAFVLNGCDDPLFSPAVSDDFRRSLVEAGFAEPRLFAVSALKAGEAKMGGLALEDDDESGQFHEFEGMIHDELESRRVGEIKRSNLDGALRDLAELLARCSPAPEDLDPEKWGADVQRIEEQLGRALARQVRISLFDGNPELERFFRDQQFGQLDGTFGVFANSFSRFMLLAALPWTARVVASAAKKRKRGAASASIHDDEAPESPRTRGLAGAQDIVRKRLAGIDDKSWRHCFEQARRDAMRLGERLKLVPDPLKNALNPLVARDVASRALERASIAVEDAVERAMGVDDEKPADPKPWWLALVSPYNILPNLLIGVALFHFTWGFFKGQTNFGHLFAGLGLALIVCAIEYAVESRRIEANGGAARRGLLDAAEGALAEEVRSALADPASAEFEKARERSVAVRALRDEIAGWRRSGS